MLLVLDYWTMHGQVTTVLYLLMVKQEVENPIP